MIKEKRMQYECFISQFPLRVNVSNILHLLQPERPDLAEKYGIEIFRALNRIVIKHDGQYWTNI